MSTACVGCWKPRDVGVHNGALAAEVRGSRQARELSGFTECLFGDGTDDDTTGRTRIQRAFPNQRSAALALLNGASRLTRKSGQFLGQLAVDETPLTDKQADWLAVLLERAGLPPLASEGRNQNEHR